MKGFHTVHQFTPAIATSDGVSQGVFYTQQLLRELGFFSIVYANHIDDALKGRVLHIDEYHPSANNVLFYHHAISHKHHELIMGFPDLRVLIYHNITPSHFFKDSPHLQEIVDCGRAQLRTALPHITASYADSRYNANELVSVGYSNPVVIPALVDMGRCLARAEKAGTNCLPSDVFNLLFVGRIVSNKNQHQLVNVLYSLQEIFGKDRVKLHLIGKVSEPEYMDFINAHISTLGLANMVNIVGLASDELLYDYMCCADLFLGLSEHEGFCMPVLESICCGLPVLAYKAGGIETTLGYAGLLSCKASNAIAQIVAGYIKDPAKLETLRQSQQKHLQQFSGAHLKQQLREFLNGL
ncbi:MAG: hypothetical protein DRH08_05915 [Deltaproteobacteria bacterium]|nr:MAG: hypothetical protein DRH08_05915 [Deltaproteobacteria bacterium]